MKQKSKQSPLKKIVLFAVIVLGAAMISFGAMYLFHLLQPNQATESSQSSNSDAPDASIEGTDETEITVDTLNNYIVAADMPRFLGIEKLNMKARIQPMGVNSEGAVQAPVNIYDSGWYTGSAKPGSPGAAFIDAHASGATRQGLFAYLDTLKNGDTITVEQGDGTIFTYKVVHSETVARDAVDMKKALSVYGQADEGLNLMTCTGAWIKNEETYDKRVVVYTERVS